MRRLLVSVIAVALVAAACGRGEPGGGAVGEPFTLDGTTTAPGDPGSGSEGEVDAGGGAAAGGAATSTQSGGGSGGAGERPGGGQPGTSAPAPTSQPWLGGPGSYAPRLLQPAPASRVVLELFQQDGAAPLPGSVAHARDRLAEVSGKPVDTAGPVALDGGARDWTAAELRAVADGQSRVPHTDDRAAVRMLFLRGTFGGDRQVLGVAVRGDVMAVFTDRVGAASSVLVPRATLEKAVTLHELGHVLGLVGLVVNAERQDPDHPGHSPNRGSVMYWAVESSLVGQVLDGPPPTEFDNADLADLAAIRRGG